VTVAKCEVGLPDQLFQQLAPSHWISHMLDVQLFGFQAGGSIISRACLFTSANAAPVISYSSGHDGGAWGSAFVAAFFALHPLHVESVAWVAERKDVLSAFFGLLCLIAYGR